MEKLNVEIGDVHARQTDGTWIATVIFKVTFGKRSSFEVEMYGYSDSSIDKAVHNAKVDFVSLTERLAAASASLV